MWDIWPYLYSGEHGPVDDLAQAVSEEYGGFYDWVVETASVDGKWYSVPHGNSSIAFAYRISLFEEAGIEDPKNNFPKTYDELFALGKTLKEMGKPLGQALGQSQGDPPAFAYPFMWATARWRLRKTAPPSPSTSRSSSRHCRPSPSTGRTRTTRPVSPGTMAPTTAPSSLIRSPATINGSSIYLAAVNAKEGESKLDYEVQVEPDDIWHAAFPAGPAGQFMPSAVARWPR